MEPVYLYVVCDKDGKWLCKRGWTELIAKAKIFGSIGPARQNVTMITNTWTGDHKPHIVKLIVTDCEVIDESERIKKMNDKKALRAAEREEKSRKAQLAHAQSQLEEARKRVEKLSGKGKFSPSNGLGAV